METGQYRPWVLSHEPQMNTNRRRRKARFYRASQLVDDAMALTQSHMGDHWLPRALTRLQESNINFQAFLEHGNIRISKSKRPVMHNTLAVPADCLIAIACAEFLHMLWPYVWQQTSTSYTGVTNGLW